MSSYDGAASRQDGAAEPNSQLTRDYRFELLSNVWRNEDPPGTTHMHEQDCEAQNILNLQLHRINTSLTSAFRSKHRHGATPTTMAARELQALRHAGVRACMAEEEGAEGAKWAAGARAAGNERRSCRRRKRGGGGRGEGGGGGGKKELEGGEGWWVGGGEEEDEGKCSLPSSIPHTL